MNDAEREHLENQLLLRASGELPPGEAAALEEILARDPGAAAFARIVAELPAAARAPRDFAAAAIRSAVPERKIIAFPRLWKLAAAAAVLVAATLAVHFSNRPPTPQPIAESARRTTTELSARLDSIESEIADARSRLGRGRHLRQTEI